MEHLHTLREDIKAILNPKDVRISEAMERCPYLNSVKLSSYYFEEYDCLVRFPKRSMTISCLKARVA
jgi:hypothetical protein